MVIQKQALRCNAILIVGDFNARHQAWNDITCNPHGVKLLDFCKNEDLNVVNSSRHNTFVCENGGSRIDLVITDTTSLVRLQTVDGETELFTGAPQRGHVPVWIELTIKPPVVTFLHTYNWAWS